MFVTLARLLEDWAYDLVSAKPGIQEGLFYPSLKLFLIVYEMYLQLPQTFCMPWKFEVTMIHNKNALMKMPLQERLHRVILVNAVRIIFTRPLFGEYI